MKELGRQGRKSVRSLPQLAHYSKMGEFLKRGSKEVCVYSENSI
jgi:hypothetical protein